MEKEIDKRNSLDQLFDDFDRKTAEQFNDILSRIESINSDLKKVLAEGV
jgi:predicted component of type VI protein secretion system